MCTYVWEMYIRRYCPRIVCMISEEHQNDTPLFCFCIRKIYLPVCWLPRLSAGCLVSSPQMQTGQHPLAVLLSLLWRERDCKGE